MFLHALSSLRLAVMKIRAHMEVSKTAAVWNSEPRHGGQLPCSLV